MSLIKRAAVATAALATAAVAVVAAGQPFSPPANATPGGRGCPPQVHRDIDGWQTKGAATVKLHTGRGVVLATTASNDDKVMWVGSAQVKLKDLGQLSYLTEVQAGHTSPAALPAYFIQVDVNADGVIDTSLMFEPYWNTPAGAGVPGTPSGEATTWDVDGGAFWSSKTVGTAPNAFVAGAGGPPFYTLAKAREMFPNAVVLGYGINLGTYNPGVAARVDSVRFGCVVHEWLPAPVPTTASPTPTATATATPTATVTVTATATPTATATATTSPTAIETTTAPVDPQPSPSKSSGVIITQPVANDDDLPLTGAGVIGIAVAGAVVLAAGAAAVVIARRRKTDFTA